MFNMIPSETEAVYTSRQVIDLVKITYRQLYHWQKNGVITCCRPGKGRGKVSLGKTPELYTVSSFLK